MFALSSIAVVALAAVTSVNAQATTNSTTEIPTTVNATEIALVQAQYEASGFDAPLPNSQSFNIPLNATALLTVVYGETTIENGSPYTADQVAAKPIIHVTPETTEGFGAEDLFTLILADASAVGQADPEGDYRHYLSNSIAGGAASNSTSSTNSTSSSSFILGNGTIITSYAGPGPLANSGVHRYAWLLFSQPSDFAAPSNLSSAGVAPGHWSVESYVKDSKLGSLVAASFFTVVHEGDSTASAVPTSSVDVATLVVPSTAAGTAATGAAASSGASGVAGAAKATSSPSTTGAGFASFTVAKGLVGLGALVAGLVVMA